MATPEMNVFEAIQIAKDAEQKAADFYADAASKVSSSLGKNILNQLVEFERHHYDKLVELEKSLHGEGKLSAYEGHDLKVPSVGEVQSVTETSPSTAMQAITVALEAEQEAEKRYTMLAGQVSEVTAQEMFKRFAQEEHKHYLVLRDAYWNLNNRGVWVLP